MDTSDVPSGKRWHLDSLKVFFRLQGSDSPLTNLEDLSNSINGKTTKQWDPKHTYKQNAMLCIYIIFYYYFSTTNHNTKRARIISIIHTLLADFITRQSTVHYEPMLLPKHMCACKIVCECVPVLHAFSHKRFPTFWCVTWLCEARVQQCPRRCYYCHFLETETSGPPVGHGPECLYHNHFHHS